MLKESHSQIIMQILNLTFFARFSISVADNCFSGPFKNRYKQPSIKTFLQIPADLV